MNATGSPGSRILTTLSQKGGTGKTTVTCALASMASKRGIPTVLLDTDPQRSALGWWQLRTAPIRNLQVHACSVEQTGPLIVSMLEAGIRFIILDTAPAMNDNARLAAAVSDSILIPVRPAVPDLAAVASTLSVGHRAQKPTRVLINGAIVRHPQIETARHLLSETDLAPVVMHQRALHQTSFASGGSAPETARTSKAAAELTAVYDWLTHVGAIPAPLPGWGDGEGKPHTAPDVPANPAAIAAA